MTLLQKLVTNCPFITFELKSKALQLIVQAQLKSVSERFRATNEHAKNPEDVLVVLLRMPYLAHPRAGTAPDIESTERLAHSLLSYLYGVDVVTQDGSALSLRKLALSYRPGPLRVPRLLCLLLGSGSQHPKRNL